MLKNLDMGAAMRRLAERKIEEAMQQGKFDNLEGAGQPLELEPMPADENARMLWWAIRILRQNDVVPDEIRYRKAIALFRQRLPDVSSEAEVRTIVEQANAIIRKLNTMGTNVIPNQTTLIDVDEELQRWRDRRSPTSPLVIRRPPVMTVADPHQFAARLKQKARSLGFDLCGITSATPSRHADYLRDWLAAGHAGEMHYLHQHFEERTDPGKLLPGARTVVCVAMNYHVPLEPPIGLRHPAKVARYALGNDYHLHLKDRLYALADWIREAVPEAQTRCGVDTAAILERELAARAGVGWIGKNTVVINERIGSWLFLGEVITTLALPLDEPAKDRCGTCRRCIDACPTQAIVEPRKLDATRCISYLTIEHRGPIAEELAGKLNGWVVGCDICQDVCPWNGRAPVATLEDLQPRHPTGTIDAEQVETWSQEDYWAATRRSATRRVKLDQFKRNAALVMKADKDAASAVSPVTR